MQSHQSLSENSTDARTQTGLEDNPVIFFKGLADETRLGVLLLLVTEGELCVCELTEALQVSQPKISRHLALLRQQGLIADRRQGVWVYYRINESLPQWAHETLKTTTEGNKAFIESSVNLLNNMGNRPERQSNCC